MIRFDLTYVEIVLQYSSFSLSSIGLFLAVLGTYCPKGASWLESFLSKLSSYRFISLPAWKWDAFIQHKALFFMIIIPAKLVADVAYLRAGEGLQALDDYIFFFGGAAVLFLACMNVLFVFWFSLKVILWSIYFIVHAILKLSVFINPDAEVVTGFGVIVAVFGFMISIVPFFIS